MTVREQLDAWLAATEWVTWDHSTSPDAMRVLPEPEKPTVPPAVGTEEPDWFHLWCGGWFG